MLVSTTAAADVLTLAKSPSKELPKPIPFHARAQALTIPLLMAWDLGVYAFDWLMAGLLWCVGLQVKYDPDVPTPTSHPGVFITGCSSGIGRCAALTFALRGFRVFAGVRKQSDADSLLNEWNEAKEKKERQGTWELFWKRVDGGSVETVLLDVIDHASLEQAFDEVTTLLGPSKGLYCVYANAGINDGCALELETRDMCKTTLDVNLQGAIDTARVFAPLLRAHGRSSRLLFTSSMLGVAKLPLVGTYSASKHGLTAAATAMRAELAQFGVAVSLMEAGEIDTEIWKKQGKLFEVAEESKVKETYSAHLKLLALIWRTSLIYPGLPTSYITLPLMHALSSGFPLPRYTIGIDAWLLRVLAATVPDRVWDGIWAAVFRWMS